MATYEELATLPGDDLWGLFKDKVAVAVGIKATAIINEAAPTAGQLAWAQQAIEDPRGSGDNIVWYVVSDNANASKMQILTAPDNAIQTNVDAAVDALYP